MRPGDLAEIAIWLTGEEPEPQIAHWKTVVCAHVAQEAAEQNNVEFGPWEFVEKHPGEDRVPPVPAHIHGPDVRLLVGAAKIGPVRPVIVRESGFVEDLKKDDLAKLRRLTRRAHAKENPGQKLTDRQCDQIIEMLGPDVAVKTLSKSNGAGA